MKTTLYVYHFDLSKPEEDAQWAQLCNDRRDAGIACESFIHTGKAAALKSGKVELDTKLVFTNQWNTVDGFRVFDWYRGIVPNHSLMIGHWLEITDEMRQLREQRLACGFCGFQINRDVAAAMQEDPEFCPKCIDSPYLKETELYLTRLRSVVESRQPFPPLSAEEAARLMPKYVTAQLHGKEVREKGEWERRRARARKAYDDVANGYAEAVRVARVERDARLWLLDRKINDENVIYYKHTGRFHFGWRQPMGSRVVDALLDVISDFPGDYDITCEDGRKLSS